MSSPGSEAADVAIIGGGVVGMSLALALRSRNVDVVVIDRGPLGSASTSLNAGGVRHQFYQDSNILAAKETVQQLANLEGEGRYNFDFHQRGYLLLFETPDQEVRLREGVERQNALGVPSRIVNLEEVHELAPSVQTEGLRGGAYCHTDGSFDPPALAQALRSSVIASGAHVVEGAEIVGIETSGERVARLLARDLQVEAKSVVNAAGAWAGEIAGLYGGTLPISPHRSQVFALTREGVPRGSELPHTFDCTSQFYVRPQGEEMWSGSGFKPVLDKAPSKEGLSADWSESHELARRVGRRFPALAGRPFKRAWAGAIEMTADSNPIVGLVHLENMYVAAGFSGHGMCIGIGLAASIADDLLGEAPPISLENYRLSRFSGESLPRGEGLWIGDHSETLDEWKRVG